MRTEQKIVLRDTYQEKESLTVNVAITSEEEDDGIIISDPMIDTRVATDRIVVENCGGHLIVHIWATAESVGNDPTHTIEILV